MKIGRAFRNTKRIFNIILSILSFIIGFFSFIIFAIYKVVNYIKRTIFYMNKTYNYLDIQKEIKAMDDRQFEIFCAELFRQLGYKAKTTQKTCDGGKDIILKKNGFTTYVECKKWNSNLVGREPLQKLVGSSIADNVLNMIFITTSDFNKNAKEYAKKMDSLKLWTTVDIMKNIERLNDNQICMIFKNTEMKYNSENIINKLENINENLTEINKSFR
ncbi:restriction endonuclease [Clostridium botulinum]|uniref:restriction endonuclease n=1 Tax=Clostridium botulinum TaxID=1491 RepID=UPI00090A348B|nr:restriction endonuclease [Clostridium botulinum]APH20988.1 restriction endonuclease family protein [Clostridium botulinum]APQ71122.1 restriction endonuclease family protein [Clostridium botulinum]